MKYMMKELREMTGMTQKAFAESYGIPLRTLQKWERGGSAPAPYVLDLIAGTLPGANRSLYKIEGFNEEIYYFDKAKKLVSDSMGNEIHIKCDLDTIKKENLKIYLQDLFKGLYHLQEKFERDCKYDKEDDIIWIR